MRKVYVVQFYTNAGELDTFGVCDTEAQAQEEIAARQARWGRDEFPTEQFHVMERTLVDA